MVMMAAFEVHQQAFQPFDRVQIQVVGGLVQQQHIGLGHQRLRQCHALLGAARQGADHGVGVQVQAVQGFVPRAVPSSSRPGFQSRFAWHPDRHGPDNTLQSGRSRAPDLREQL
jgi:hypothetical protein